MKVKIQNAFVDKANHQYVLLPPVEVIQHFKVGDDVDVRVTPIPTPGGFKPHVARVKVLQYYEKYDRRYVVLPIVRVSFDFDVGDVAYVKVTRLAKAPSIPLSRPKKFTGKFVGGPGLVRKFAATAALLPKIRGLRFIEDGLVVEMFEDQMSDWAMLTHLFGTFRAEMPTAWVSPGQERVDAAPADGEEEPAPDDSECGTCNTGTCGCGSCVAKRSNILEDPTLRMLFSQ